MTIDTERTGAEAPVRIKVWDLPTRVFHWLLALSFVGAWLTAEADGWHFVHRLLGYTVALLLIFRLVWGVVGTRHARFASFAYAPATLVAYLASLWRGQARHYTGHNPAGALAIFALLALGAVTVLSGIGADLTADGEWLGEIHEGLAAAMLTVVVVHIAGVVVSSLLHRENLVRSMVDGWKSGAAQEGITGTRPLVAACLLVAVAGLWGGERLGWITLAPTDGGESRATAPGGEHHGRGDRDRRRHDDDD